MNNFQRSLIFILLFSFAIIQSCKKDSNDNDQPSPTPTPTPTPTVMTGRDSAVQEYNNNYLGSAISTSGWTGTTTGCTAGSISAAAHTAAINRINYFRKLVGLNGTCTMDTTKYQQEQETSLMEEVHGSLSHTPDASWTCYTAAGAAGAGSSNLAFGGIASTAIDLFINDFGTGNEPCGHRRWILYSPRTTFSDGSTNSYYSLWVFGAGGNTTIPSFIAYPCKGYMPQGLVYDRWSFGIPGANFSSSTVTMTGPSGSVPLSIISTTVGYGDNTIIWLPTGIDRTNTADVSYTVTVSGITGAAQTSYTYNVIIFKP